MLYDTVIIVLISLWSGRLYDASMEELYLVFEDLTTMGYCNVDKRKGFTMEQHQLALSKVAKWHAATAVLLAQVDQTRVFARFQNLLFFFPLFRRTPFQWSWIALRSILVPANQQKHSATI